MTKNLLHIFIFLFTFTVSSISADARRAIEISEVGQSAVTLTVLNGSEVRVTGANGMILTVYNVAGVRVAAFKIDSPDKIVNMGLARGIYIVKIGDVVRKIFVN